LLDAVRGFLDAQAGLATTSATMAVTTNTVGLRRNLPPICRSLVFACIHPLEAYRREAEIPPGISAVMQAALRSFLADRGYLEENDRKEVKKRPWPQYPLYSGDPTLAERTEEALSGGPDTPAFGEH
jgi:hypothetical protein